ncbi:LysR family transcriptional regulator [Acidiphilium acidophilum]|uniref:LysR family transcriptional regulator n=1 Tax=Acidiphilium acidophilum TaxID=76588 RepID=UPI002E8E688F|nr:LysR family transcriptional regulator [Acidiphilium acidophilum]
MTLDQLQIFAAVAEREHVTRAAEAMDMTQSAVSAAVASLEREFGTKLFHRVGRGIMLTEGGKLFLSEARAVLSRAEAARLSMHEFSGLARGRLEIKASQTIASHFLPERLVDFHKSYPGLVLVVSVGNSAQVAQAITDGEVELGFIEGPEDAIRDHPHLATELIAQDSLVMVVSSKHPWAKQKKFTAEDLAAGNWVVREDGSGTRAAFIERLGTLGVPYETLHIVIQLPSNEAVLAAVLADAGAAILSKSVCASALQAGTLKSIPVSLAPRAFRAVQHADRYRSRAVGAFLGILRGRAA